MSNNFDVQKLSSMMKLVNCIGIFYSSIRIFIYQIQSFRFWNILCVSIKYRTMLDSAEYQNFFIWIFCDKLSTREPITVLISFCPILMIYILYFISDLNLDVCCYDPQCLLLAFRLIDKSLCSSYQVLHQASWLEIQFFLDL